MNAPVSASRVIDIDIFAGDPKKAAIADKLRVDDDLTMEMLRDAYGAAGNDATQRAVLREMIAAARQQVPEGAMPAHKLRARDPSEIESRGARFARELRGALDKVVIGQDRPKQALCTIMRANPPGRGTDTNVLALTGPSGVGKTEFALAITEVLHGKGVKPITLEGAMFKHLSDLSILEGAAPGLVQSDETAKISPLSQENVQQSFKGKKPLVILIDEIDDIGVDGDPQMKSAFWSKMNTAIDKGYFKLKDGTEIDLRGALIIVTSNAGLKEVGNLEGEEAAMHYRKAFDTAIPEPKIINRIGRGNIIPFDCLTPSEHSTITETKFITPEVEKARSENAQERGVDVSFELDPKALELLSQLTFSRTTGARGAREVTRKILRPLIADGIELANDDDRVRLTLKPEFSDIDRNRLLRQFQATDGMPPDLTVENCPWKIDTKAAHRSFVHYAGDIPLSPVMSPIIHGSGAFAGDGFLLYNQAEEDSKNQLLLLRDAPLAKNDKIREISLPPAIADANLAVQGVALSEHQMLLTGVTVDGTEATAAAFIYDDKTKQAVEVEPPPLPLVGASLTAVGGYALLTGGRPVFHDGTDWSVELPTIDSELPSGNLNNGLQSQDQAWLFDPQIMKWEALDSAPREGRSGVSTVAVGDKVYLFGGESSAQHHSGTRYTTASRATDVFDLKTKAFTLGPDLPYGVAHAEAIFDHENNRVLLMGGVDYVYSGSQSSPKQSMVAVTIDKQGDVDPEIPMKVRRDVLPSESAQLAAIARGPSYVVGPFADDDGMPIFAELV